MLSGAACFGLAIDLEINILEDAGFARYRAFLGELGAGFGFRFGCFVDFVEPRFCNDSFFEEALFE